MISRFLHSFHFLLFFSLALMAFPQATFCRLRIPVTQAMLDTTRFDASFWQSVPDSDVVLSFPSGLCYWQERQVDFSGVNRPDLHVVLEGDQTVLMAKGSLYRETSRGEGVPYQRPYSLESGWMEEGGTAPVDFRGKMKLSRFFCPIPLNPFKKLYVLPTREADLSESEAKDVYLLLTQWYVGAVYKVKKIRRGWVFFYRDVDYGLPMYAELRFGRCLSRYALINRPDAGHPYIRDGRLLGIENQSLYCCEQSVFLQADSCRLRSLRLDGLEFGGNYDNGQALLLFHTAESDSISIGNCRFNGIRTDVLASYDTDNVFFTGNEVVHCYRRGIYSDWLSDRLTVRRNLFDDHGRIVSTGACVHCQGADFEVSDNRFKDFTYMAIGVGTHFLESDGAFSSGKIFGNEIFQTSDFLDGERRYLTDSGAIYVWTQNKGVEIFNNYIHDIGGSHGNRGILCDDGVCHVDIHDNLILRVLNHYTIDLRKKYRILRKRGNLAREVNVGNRMVDNIVDGRYRFFLREDDPTSEMRGNVVLPSGYDSLAVVQEWKRKTGSL